MLIQLTKLIKEVKVVQKLDKYQIFLIQVVNKKSVIKMIP